MLNTLLYFIVINELKFKMTDNDLKLWNAIILNRQDTLILGILGTLGICHLCFCSQTASKRPFFRAKSR